MRQVKDKLGKWMCTYEINLVEYKVILQADIGVSLQMDGQVQVRGGIKSGIGHMLENREDSRLKKWE
jgi:hypothetical protein